MKKVQYYLGRVHKLGRLNDDLLTEAIREPKIHTAYDYAWTFTGTIVKQSKDGSIKYIYSELCKFEPSGTITVIDEEQHSKNEITEPNLVMASSPFIYIPHCSGIAYQHIWNKIEKKAFIKNFSNIVKISNDNFFVDCDIEPITDLVKFYHKLASIKDITEIKAKVTPPNPLFGRAWKDLKEYLSRRAVSELNLREKGRDDKPLSSKIAEYIKILIEKKTHEKYEPDEPIDLTDAAVLMAADGYGTGKVVGKVDGSIVTVNTSESQLNFVTEANISPDHLYEEAHLNFERINIQRDLGHQ